MSKLNYKHKKAFTLIELLIVIAIIGILFIVLVSKVDFATDKAKATGVQTDFRSFQMAFDTVAKENAGFNTFGWDTGDVNQDGIRNSYDEGDNGAGGGTAKNGIQDGTEVFTGHKVYDETFTKVFSLKKNGTGSYDRDALNRLETAINANLDPKLHITIKDDGEIVMANGARDPWNKEYHGYYITNAEADGKDRGAIVMYSDGANNEFGSDHKIANGIVSISISGNNKAGKDDYSIVSIYSYVNGYGEVLNITTGFSNNQTLGANSVLNSTSGGEGAILPTPNLDGTVANSVSPIAYEWSELKTLAQAKLSADELRDTYGIEVGDYKEVNSVKYVLVDLGLDEGDYDGFVFMYKTGTQKAMNSTYTNKGGYASTNVMKDYVDGLYASLETSNNKLYQAIKKVNIVCNDGRTAYGSAIYTHNVENVGMFLASAKEVGINASALINPKGYVAEGECFDLFTDDSSRTEFMSTANISIRWWLRSAVSSENNYFLYIDTDGHQIVEHATGSLAVMPAFVIG